MLIPLPLPLPFPLLMLIPLLLLILMPNRPSKHRRLDGEPYVAVLSKDRTNERTFALVPRLVIPFTKTAFFKGVNESCQF